MRNPAPSGRWFWLRSARARPLAFWAFAGLSAAAVLAASLAPLLLGVIQTTSLAQETRSAVHAQTSIEGVADVEKGRLEAPEKGAVALVSSTRVGSLWRPARIAAESQDAVKWLPAGTASTRQAFVSAPSSGCDGIRMTAGECRLGQGDVLVAKSTAESDNVQPGMTIVLPGTTTTLRVAGLYDDQDALGRFIAAPAFAVGSHSTIPSSDLVVGSSTFEALGLNGSAYAVRHLAAPLRPGQLGTVRAVLQDGRARELDHRSGLVSARFHTGIDEILDRNADSMAAAGTLVEVIALEAVGAAWLAAGLLSHRVSRERAPEIALARARGFSRRHILAVAFAEPLVAVAAGVVPGLLLAVGSSFAIAPALLGGRLPGAASGSDARTLGIAAALAVLGVVALVVLAAWRNVHLPLMQAFRERSEPRELSRSAFAIQAVVVLVTVGLVATLVTQGPVSGLQTAVLTPTLIALSIALLALRLVVTIVRRSTVRVPRSLGALTIARRLGRTPTMLWGPVLLSVGVALIVFSITSATTITRWQTERAGSTIGATTVLHVSAPDSTDLEALVRRADPRGHTAMAAAETTSGSGPARVLAVDTRRLAAVTTWSPAWSGLDFGSIARKLAPATGRSIVVRGTRLALGVSDVRGTGSAGLVSSVELDMVVSTPAGWRTLDLGTPHDGVLTARMNCATGCRVVYIGAFDDDPSPLPFSFHVTLSSLSTDVQSAKELNGSLTAGQWRDRIGDSTSTELPTTARVKQSTAGLSVDFADAGGGDLASIAPRDAVEPIPVLSVPSNDAVAFPGLTDTFLGSGIDGSSRLIRVVGSSGILPRLGGSGVLADLGEMNRVSDPAGSGAEEQVWLAPGQHPAVIARLRAEGVRILSTETTASARRAFLLESPSLATRADLPIALVGLLAALAALLAARAVAAPSRRSETASLRAAGIRTARLNRLLRLEFFLPPALGVATGVVGGLLASVVTVSHLPLLVHDGAVPPAPSGVDPASIGAVVIVLLVVVSVIAVFQARRDLKDGRVA